MRNFKMKRKTPIDYYTDSVFFLAITILLPKPDKYCSVASLEHDPKTKSATFLSPMLVMEPGSVHYSNYYNIEFPRGHIGVKNFNGEIVDDAGNSVPLHEAYLHHWLVSRYFQRHDPEDNGVKLKKPASYIMAGNSGTCQGNVLRQFFGLGSETRRTDQRIPDPYAIEIGNPDKVLAGYEERWKMYLHVIDTRGVEDKLGCTECKCDVYNLTVDEYGQRIIPDYRGGSRCCYHLTRCKLREGFEGVPRNLYLRYTVTWVDWDSSVLPVNIFILDITDTGKRSDETWLDETIMGPNAGCQVEYSVKACNDPGGAGNECIDHRRTSIILPTGGYVLFAVAHQHTGGIGSALYGEDGRVICTSLPIYGKGDEVGNESGYLVEMTTCYPKPGSMKVVDGENLVMESNYSTTEEHTGVMGLFYIAVADQLPDHRSLSPPPTHGHKDVSAYALGTVALLGPAALLVGIGLKSCRKRKVWVACQPFRT